MHIRRFFSIAMKLLENSFCNNTTFQSNTFLSRPRSSSWSCHKCLIARKTHSSTREKQTSKRKDVTQETFKTPDELIVSLKERPSKKCSYVFKESMAKSLVRSILCNRVNPKAPVLEIEPGIGLVSTEFLNQGVEQVISMEVDTIFHPHLQLIHQKYGEERFGFYNWNMLNFFEKFNDYPSRENKLSYKATEAKIVERLSRSDFIQEETPYSIFTLGGSQDNHNLIFYILRNLPNYDPILSKERVEFFFLVHPKFKISIEEILPTDVPSSYTRYYSHFHTFISLMYDISFIDEVEANDFVPAFSRNGVTKKLNPHKRHLVRMQLKADISQILPFDHHYAFSIFLRHLFRKRKIRIVPVMETLVTGCGLQMLANGFTMLETVADVSPQCLLQLYKSMLSWPEYSVSHLKNHILMKTQGGPMDNDDI